MIGCLYINGHWMPDIQEHGGSFVRDTGSVYGGAKLKTRGGLRRLVWQLTFSKGECDWPIQQQQGNQADWTIKQQWK